MAIEIIDAKELAQQNRKRTVLMATRKMHSWLIYYEPGRHDEMHCHNNDQVFHMISGECNMSFPDGGVAVLKPGMSALITAGSFYRLENRTDEPMVLLGARTGAREDNQHILYATREDIRAKKRAEKTARQAAGGGASGAR